MREELETTAAGFPDVDVQLDVDEHLVVLADRLRLHQVLGNLVRNAQRYGAPPVLITAARRPGGLVQIVVCDAGDGVPAAFVPRLFDPHTRGPGTGQTGTGLGLSVARDLAQRQGGNLTYDVDGHRFVLNLPSPGAVEPAAGG